MEHHWVETQESTTYTIKNYMESIEYHENVLMYYYFYYYFDNWYEMNDEQNETIRDEKMKMEKELMWIKKKEKVFNCRQNIFFLNILSIEFFINIFCSPNRPYTYQDQSTSSHIAGGQPATATAIQYTHISTFPTSHNKIHHLAFLTICPPTQYSE